MIVATNAPPASRSLRARLVAISAISWSPSRISPRSSVMISRSASPSSAMPRSARRASTSRRICSGAKAPQSRLMLSPSGDTPI